jgi:hypothetical protein
MLPFNNVLDLGTKYGPSSGNGTHVFALLKDRNYVYTEEVGSMFDISGSGRR